MSTRVSPASPAQETTGAPTFEQHLDWRASSWGAPAEWCASLASAVALADASPFPVLVAWGQELATYLNPPAQQLRAPEGLPPSGISLGVALGDAWPALAPIIDSLLTSSSQQPPGTPQPLAETTTTWRCSPLFDEKGAARGVICQRVIAPEGGDYRKRLSQALALQQERMIAAFEQSPAFMAVLRGPDYVIESANGKLQTLVGGRAQIGVPVRQALPELEQQGFITLLDRVRESRQPFIGESVANVLGPPGATKRGYADFVYQPMFDETGAVDAILIHGIDRTEQRLVEERDSFLLLLEDELQRLTDPHAVVETCVRMVGEHLQVNRCAFALINESATVGRVAADYVDGMQSLRGEFDIDMVSPEFSEHLLQNRPWILNDLATSSHKAFLEERYRELGIRASMVVPLHKGGRMMAVMGIHQITPRTWTSTEIELLRLVVGRCWESIQRARAQRRLAESEARLRRLADALPQMIFVGDANGRTRYFNQRWYDYTGLEPTDDEHANWASAHTAEGLSLINATWRRAQERTEGYELECQLRRHDGVLRWHLVRALPVVEEEGDLRQWIGTYTDIDDRRTIEQRLQESELRFRNLCETAPVMIWMANAEGDCEYINPQWFEFTGLIRRDILTRGWLDAVHVDDAARVSHAFVQALEDRHPFHAEYRLRRYDGEYRWVMDTASPRFGLQGDFLGHIGSVLDISERKRIEDATASERAVLGLITTGASFNIVLDAIAGSVEARGERPLHCSIMLASEEDSALRFGAAPSMPPEFRQAFESLQIEPDDTTCGRAAYFRRQVICEDVARDPYWGNYREKVLAMGIASCCVTPILGSHGVLLGTLAMYYNLPYLPSLHEQAMARSASHLAGIVIERNHIDQQLQQSLEAETAARADAEHASRIKDEFLATLSHELRTPLNAILGWSRLMQTDTFEAANIDKGLVIIERSARAQAQIIDDLLDMSAILSGKVRLEREIFDLGGLVRSTIDLLRPTATGKQIDLSLITDLAQGPSFHGDAGRLQQVLTNLIGNAIKFTPADGKVTISLSIDEAEHQVEVAVKDTGVGIDPQFLPHVFDRFRQADAGTTRRVGGLGLGLSISRQLAELHAGSLRAFSEGRDQGATFVLTLPIPPPTLDTQQPPRERNVGALPASAANELQGCKILLVDDDEDSRSMAARFLATAGASVEAVASADEAENALRARGFDLMVSDIGMPGRDGHELIRAIRGGHAGGDTQLPAIALTAYVRSEDREKILRSGFNVHLGKPLEPMQLIGYARRLSERRRSPTTSANDQQ